MKMQFKGLLKFWSLSSNLRNKKTDFKHIYALGDSFTDTGNTYITSNFTEPDADVYYEGRFSSGPTWVEYLKDSLGAKLTNYAFGGATSDRNAYPFPHEEISGCLQQADIFIKEYKNKNFKSSGRALTSLSFFGNDFQNHNATANLSSLNMYKCLRKIIDRTEIKDFIIVTSIDPGLYPVFSKVSREVAPMVIQLHKDYCQLLRRKMRKLKREFPEITFYEIDFRNLLKWLVHEKIPLQQNGKKLKKGSCIPLESEDPDYKPIPCKDPVDIFSMTVFILLLVHQAISDMVLLQLPKFSR